MINNILNNKIITFHIPRDFTFIWDKLQGLLSSCEALLDLDGGCQELDWTFVGNRTSMMIITNDAYHKLFHKHEWMEERVIKQWGFCKPITWWFHVIKACWYSRLMLRAKVFIWRVIITIGGYIKKRNVVRGMCFFCSVELEHSRHRFLSCQMARMVWRCINLECMSLTGVILSSFNWVLEVLRATVQLEYARMQSPLTHKLG